MKIILSNYRYFMSGGPETYLFTIQDILRSHGHDVVPFSVKAARNVPSEFESEFLSSVGGDNSAYFHEYSKDPRTLLKVFERQMYSPEAFLRARSLAQKVQPDLIYSLQFMNKMSPAVLDGFRSAGRPVVLRISDFGLICPQAHFYDGDAACTLCIGGNFTHAVRKKCVMNSTAASLVKSAALILFRLLRCQSRISAFVFPSQFTLDRFKEAGFPSEKLHYLPTPVDTTSIASSKLTGGDILYFGRLVAEKGVHHLLEAYRNLPRPKPQLVIVGGKPDTSYARSLIDANPDVEFHEFVPRKQISKFLDRAGQVVVPSVWYDNLPNTLLEAYAHGKPVIAPKHGSFPALVEDGRTGLLYTPGNVQSLQDRLAWAIENPLRMAEMGNSARTYVENEFSPELHYSRLMSIFRSVLE